jgi:hypothetical protein
MNLLAGREPNPFSEMTWRLCVSGLAPATMFPMMCTAAEDDQVHLEVTSHERVEIAE